MGQIVLGEWTLDRKTWVETLSLETFIPTGRGGNVTKQRSSRIRNYVQKTRLYEELVSIPTFYYITSGPQIMRQSVLSLSSPQPVREADWA